MKPYQPTTNTRTRSVSRGLAALALGQLQRQSPETILRQHWPHDDDAALIVKGAASPTMLTDVETTSKWLFLSGLAPQSAAIRLFAAATRLDMDGMHLITVPSATTVPAPVFVGEGSPFPMLDGVTAAASIGPTRKMMLGTAVTAELEFAVPETASTIIGRLLSEQAGKSLDAVVFDNVAADTVRPAGLLNGVAPLAASAASGLIALVEDLRNLAAALSTAGLDADRAIFFANPAQAIALRLLAGPQFTNTIIGTNALTAGTVAAVDPVAIASGYSGVPEIDISRQGIAHFESSPEAIGTAGSPNTVATPTLSAFQQNLLMLRLRTRCCWGVLVPGAVQVVNNVVW